MRVVLIRMHILVEELATIAEVALLLRGKSVDLVGVGVATSGRRHTSLVVSLGRLVFTCPVMALATLLWSSAATVGRTRRSLLTNRRAT
jgi:hypothetical protein